MLALGAHRVEISQRISKCKSTYWFPQNTNFHENLILTHCALFRLVQPVIVPLSDRFEILELQNRVTKRSYAK